MFICPKAGFFFEYLYEICFIFALFIKLINLTGDLLNNQQFKNNNSNLYSVIRYLLIALILFNLILLIIGFVNLFLNLINLI